MDDINRPRILGSDVDVLEAIASRRCDMRLTNHYYLAHLADDADFQSPRRGPTRTAPARTTRTSRARGW